MVLGASAIEDNTTCKATTELISVTSSSSVSDFELDQLQRSVAETAFDDTKLVLGGSLNTDSYRGYAAIAQINLSDNSVDFTRRFILSGDVSAVTSYSDDATAKIHALVTQNLIQDNSKAYIYTLDVEGQIIGQPISVPLPSFQRSGSAQFARASLLLDSDSNLVVAFGHETRRGIAQISTHSLKSRQILSTKDVTEFLPSGGSNAFAMMTLSNGQQETLYLAGQKATKAAIAAVILTHGSVSDPALVTLTNASQTKHVFIDSNGEESKLFGTTQNARGDQVGLFKINLDQAGNMLEGTQAAVNLPAKTTVSGMLPSLQGSSVHVVVSTAEHEQLYVVYDFARDQIVKAMPVVGPNRGPMMTLMTLNGPNSDRIDTTLVSVSGEALFKANFDHDEQEDDSIESLDDCDWDFILESLHIAFMQQEALRFEQSGSLQDEPLNSSFQRGHDEKEQKNNDQKQNFNEESSSIGGGDLRMVQTSDDDDEDTKRRKRRQANRRRLSDSGSGSGSGSGSAKKAQKAAQKALENAAKKAAKEAKAALGSDGGSVKSESSVSIKSESSVSDGIASESSVSSCSPKPESTCKSACKQTKY